MIETMSEKVIHIGKVTVPLVDYAVGAAAVLGIRDSGKTVTSKGIAEQLLDNGVPIIVFDAVGKWRWMKVPGKGANGKGYKVVVAGGRNPDLPLNPHSVPEIVRSALKERIPLVIDLFDKNLSKADWRRIVQQAIRIIHYENEGGAVHVFLEEAAEFVPQRVIDGEVYAEVEKLVRMGGNASVGITLINQRSQEVNKSVLDQCTTLILGCQVGSKAIEAIGKWVDRLDSETANAVTSSLPTLTAGDDWVWTRQNPDRPHRVQVPMCRSFHPDRRTPEIVLQSVKPTDTAEFVAKMTSAIPKIIEDARANDPVLLKRELAVLRKQVAHPAPAPVKPAAQVKPREVLVIKDAQITRLERMLEKLTGVESIIAGGKELVTELREAAAKLVHPGKLPALPGPLRAMPPARIAQVTRPVAQANGSETNGALGRCERAVLAVLAQYPQGRTASQCAILSSYSKKSSGFSNALSALRTAGYIDRNNPIHITEDGKQIIGPVDPTPTGIELQSQWLSKLGLCERKILQSLIQSYPSGMMPDALGDAAGYSTASSGFSNALSKLRSLELIERGQPIKASDNLFE